VIRFCRERLSSYKCPESVDFVDLLPRDPNGKVRKKRIQRAVLGGPRQAQLTVQVRLPEKALRLYQEIRLISP
jgi:acyl-CoA synthetase (AMP-forming)/AMP-acid ligase II